MAWVRWRVAFCDTVHCAAKLKSRELPFAWIHIAVCKIPTSCCIQKWLGHTFSYPLLFSIIHNREHEFSYKSVCFWQSLSNKVGHWSISRTTCSRPQKLYQEYILGTFFLYYFIHIVISSLFYTPSNEMCYFSHSFLFPDWHLSQNANAQSPYHTHIHSRIAIEMHQQLHKRWCFRSGPKSQTTASILGADNELWADIS